MKNIFKKIISFVMAVSLFVSCPIFVYASNDHPWEGGLGLQLYYNLDEIKQYIKDTAGFWIYYAHQLGAVVHADFTKFVENSDKFDELLDDENVGLYKDDVGNIKGVYTSKNFMAQLKALLDDYAKENEPYIIKPTYKYTEVPASQFNSATDYNKFRSYAYSHDLILFRNCYNNEGMYLGDLTEEYKNGGGFIFNNRYQTYFYMLNSNWELFDLPCSYYAMEKDENGTYSFAEPADYVFPLSKHSFIGYSEGLTNFKVWDINYGSRESFLITKDGGRIRIFKSKTEFMDYSAGQRKVYYTSNYYDYVPEDLTVSIDELQKTIEDMQDVIDKLLEQITDNTSESEIEELLRLILEELRNGGGNGSGSGGGDINVDIDLSTTNSWLSKIYTKVSQIFDKISETATGVEDAVNTKLQETLDEILDTLKSIRRWTIADTVFDGLDALADIASFLKDFLTAPAAAIGTAASSLGDAADMLTDRFPFSIPWDMAALVTLLSAEPQAPVFKLPIVIESYGIEEYIEIDMSQYEYLSTIMRGMLSIIYAYGILSMTTKVIDVGGKK